MTDLTNAEKKLLHDIYYDYKHPASFSSSKMLYNAAKKKNRLITIKKVLTFLQGQQTYTLHKLARKRFARRKTVVRRIHQQLQTDLIDISALKAENKNFTFLLTATDVLTRFSWAFPLLNKTGAEVVKAFKKILVSALRRVPGRPVRSIQSDRGKEYYNKTFKEFCQTNKISHFSTFSDTKCAISERFNRTLQDRLHKYFTASNSLTYVKVLKDIVNAINHKRHPALGMAPYDTSLANEHQIYDRQFAKYFKEKMKAMKFKVGDKVRISKYRGIFQKGYLASFNKEIFVVSKVLETRPPTYKIMDSKKEVLRGAFYASELMHVRQIGSFGTISEQ